MNKSILNKLKSFIIILVFLTTYNLAYSQVVKPFSIKFQTTQKGGIVYLSNVATGCSSNPSSSGGSCQTNSMTMPPSGSGINNNFNQVYVDIDGDASTFQSSSDSLVLPNCSNITWAGLFWGAMGNANNCPTRNNIKLKVNNGLYQNIRADDSMLNTAGYNSYHSFKNITSIVQAAGTKAKFTIANIPFVNNGNSNNWGSWQIVVVYGNQLLGMRQLTVFNGLANVSGSNTVLVPISGFLTPPMGPVKFELGTYVHDGDRSLTGDQMQFSGNGGPFINISDALNSTNDIFNSTVSNKGVLTPYRIPNLNNTMGLDADIFEPNNVSKTYLGNAHTNARLRLTTGGETYLVQEISTAIDVFEPDLRVDKKVFDRFGNNMYNGTVNPGDTLVYRVTVYNIGTDTAVNTFVTDSIRREAKYVPNSINYLYGPNIGTKTDGALDDQAEFNPLTLKFKFRVGTAANAVLGGRVLNSMFGSDSTVLQYKVVAEDDCSILQCNNVIANSSLVTSTGKISGNTLTVGSNPAAFDVSGCPISGTTNTFINVSLLSCVFPPDTTIATLCPAFESLASLYPRPGYSKFYNSSFNEVITAVSPGTYYAFRVGPTGCIDTVLINVLATACDPPNIGIDCGTIFANSTKSGNMGINNYFPLGYTGTNFITTPIKNASNGIFSINSSGNYSYNPNANFVGKDTIVVSYCGNPLIPGPSLCMDDTLFINILPEITIANNSFSTTNSTLVTGNINSNNSHPNSLFLLANVVPVKEPDNGVFNISNNGVFNYTPNTGFAGKDTVVVNVCATVMANSCLVDTLVSCKNDTLFFEVLQTSVSNISICDASLPYIWNGNTYTTEGTYTVHLLSSGGFDSIAILNLSINPSPVADYAINSPIQCDNNLFAFTNNSSVKNQTIFKLSDIGSTPSAVDNDAVELGVKFRADVNGVIKGIRFYKLATSSGTFVGNLYTNSGTLLSSANFTTSASGWQEVLFTTPISITANTTYVASYYAPNGGYAFDAHYFATSAKMNGNLKALKDGEDGSNSVFLYGVGGGFPVNTFNSANYWVDVVFMANDALTYNWSFGDGNFSTATNPTKNYPTSGTYNVKLVTTNSFGCKDSITKQVSNNKPTASFTYSKNCKGEVTFNNTSTNATDYEWIIGNKTICTTDTIPVQTLYSDNVLSGTSYMVTLIAKNNSLCYDTMTQLITIYPPAISIFSATPLGCSTKVNFNNFTMFGNSYSWDFGVVGITTDTSTLMNPSYTYPSNGTYQVRLISNNNEGCGDTLILPVVVNSGGITPTANFTISNVSNSCAKRFNFTNTSVNGVSYQWIFHDGSQVYTTNASKSYANAGTYAVKLIAKSSTGCYDTIISNVTVIGNSAATVASFTINNRTQCLKNNSFEFYNTSVHMGPYWIPTYNWDFGDGTFDNSNSYVFNKHYATAGVYTVRMIAVGTDGCRDTAYQTIEVLPSPIASFTANTSCGMTAQINNLSTGAIANIWNFGTGYYEENNASSFAYTYKDEDWYFINLTVVGANGCKDMANVGVYPTRVGAPQPSFSYDTLTCSNAIKFTNTSIGGATASWNFGDGSPISNSFNPTHVYNAAGTYTVILTLSNGPFCSATYSQTVSAPQGINVLTPAAGLTYQVAACSNTITSTDTSLNTTIRNWYFDGVLVSVLPTVNITNPTVGGHELKLVVSNGVCYDTIKQFILIQSAPISAVSHTSSTCSRTVVFSSQATNGNTYNWNFNDAGSTLNTATGSVVTHTFSANGTYYVSLSSTNLSGCTTSTIDTVVVNAGNNPINAAFKFDNHTCNCVCNNKIKFTNLSTGAGNTYFWSFGDGSTSTQTSPNKGFAAAGTYNVTLTATSPSGCISVSTMQVNILPSAKGPSASFNTDNQVQCLTGNNFSFYNTSSYMGAGWNTKYYWNFGDGTIDTMNTFVFNKHYTAVGTYTVTLVALGSDNCKDTMTMTVVVRNNNCLSYSNPIQVFNPSTYGVFEQAASSTTTKVTEQIESKNDWTLYPNPNGGKFSVSSKNINNASQIQVIDVLGREVNVTIIKKDLLDKIEFEITNPVNGCYLIFIKNGNGNDAKIKFNVTNN